MTIHHLPPDHLQLSCDSGCTNMIVRHGITEEELLDLAEAQGWNIERELGLHYCPLTTMHDCEVCGAPTQMSIGEPRRIASEADLRSPDTSERRYYCAEHWPY